MKKSRKNCITATVAAEITGHSSTTIRTWGKKGVIKAEKDEHGHQVYLLKDLRQKGAAKQSRRNLRIL